nr:hypothetical protein [Oscillochloris trichoides]
MRSRSVRGEQEAASLPQEITTVVIASLGIAGLLSIGHAVAELMVILQCSEAMGGTRVTA